jgi:hypothetical protein
MTIQQEIHNLQQELYCLGKDEEVQIAAYLGDSEWKEFLMSLEPWQYYHFREDWAKFGLPIQFERAMIFRVAVKSHRHITTIPKP